MEEISRYNTQMQRQSSRVGELRMYMLELERHSVWMFWTRLDALEAEQGWRMTCEPAPKAWHAHTTQKCQQVLRRRRPRSPISVYLWYRPQLVRHYYFLGVYCLIASCCLCFLHTCNRCTRQQRNYHAIALGDYLSVFTFISSRLSADTSVTRPKEEKIQEDRKNTRPLRVHR